MSKSIIIFFILIFQSNTAFADIDEDWCDANFKNKRPHGACMMLAFSQSSIKKYSSSVDSSEIPLSITIIDETGEKSLNNLYETIYMQNKLVGHVSVKLLELLDEYQIWLDKLSKACFSAANAASSSPKIMSMYLNYSTKFSGMSDEIIIFKESIK